VSKRGDNCSAFKAAARAWLPAGRFAGGSSAASFSCNVLISSKVHRQRVSQIISTNGDSHLGGTQLNVIAFKAAACAWLPGGGFACGRAAAHHVCIQVMTVTATTDWAFGGSRPVGEELLTIA
jgi:hypothetical protein